MNTSYNLESEQDRLSAIAAFLANKPREQYYEVQYLRYVDEYEVDDMEPCFLKKFTEEQLEKIREIIETCKTEDVPFWEVIEDYKPEDIEFLQKEAPDNSVLVPNGVNLENPYHVYKFKMAVFYNGIEKEAKIYEFNVELTDEEYITLVDWKICNRHSGFNFLRCCNLELFKKLSNRFESAFSFDFGPTYYAPTYAIEMTEIEEDAKKIQEAYENQ
ncbi:MAG: hypothetical protein IKY67_12595 [Paludibacteraceae bacterium]|nr:hypothetical protein [Paludibacteraceae bacterium]